MIIKKIKLVGGCVAVIAASITVVHACCQMNSSTIGCAGSRTFAVVCKACCPWPDLAFCSGSSAGTSYPDGTGGNRNGTAYSEPKVGICKSTVTFAAGCCGGAITTTDLASFYGYSSCAGSNCGP
jgi:hypothetical protein